jgi:hypothetical protein
MVSTLARDYEGNIATAERNVRLVFSHGLLRCDLHRRYLGLAATVLKVSSARPILLLSFLLLKSLRNSRYARQ